MCHMSACAIISYISIAFLKIVYLQNLKSRSYFVEIATVSAVFCASVVGGNISLRYLPVSFNQAVGATFEDFMPVPYHCRLILAVHEDDLRNPIWAPPGGYGIDPDWSGRFGFWVSFAETKVCH
ncbi:hypothetical protein ACOSQ3_012012 [Xanthoceras sorbifolium]